jgi:hypothetical protein
MRSKPASLGCRVKTEDKEKFLAKCRVEGKKPQEILEKFVLWWVDL